jgi:hypothetical protein
MKNIHILSTENSSRLWFHKLNRNLGFSDLPMEYNGSGTWVEGRNIYITNSEEIKEGQNYIEDGFSGKNKFKWHKSQVELYPNIKKDKIILTTDQDLIKDGVQAIDDEFLEWFIKNPSCEEVEVGKTNKLIDNYTEKDEDKWEVKYHIYIPKEQDKKLYSEEDMLNFAWFLVKNIGQYSSDKTAHFEGEYLKQFKNK